MELIASRPLANLWKADRADGSTRDPRVVVVRVAHHTMDTRAMSELRKEYDALRAIDDPRVRKVHGFYAGFGALALEFVDGVSLRSVVERAAAAGQTLDLASVVDVGVELVAALRAVHDAGVVHGRVSVDTVRLRSDGGVVLTDFAFPLERLLVVPPELKTGHAALAATDQWLLGALLVHLVTGQALLGGVLGDPADGRRDVRPWVASVSAQSPALGRVVAKMLARDARDRYADEGMLSRELLATLRAIDTPPDREALARRNHTGSRLAPPAPALLPPPTPRMAPPPERREVTMRPLPRGSGRLDLAPTIPPEGAVLPDAAAFDGPQATEIVGRAEHSEPPRPSPIAALPRSGSPVRGLDHRGPTRAGVEPTPLPNDEPTPTPNSRSPIAALGTGLGAPVAPPVVPPAITLPPPRGAPPPSAEAPSLAAPTPRPGPLVAPPPRQAPVPGAPPLARVPESSMRAVQPTDIVAPAGEPSDPALSPPPLASAPALPTSSWTPVAPDLVPAVHDEEDTDLPSISSPARPRPEAAVVAPPAARLVPDWVAGVALIGLLAVGAWAVISRFW